MFPKLVLDVQKCSPGVQSPFCTSAFVARDPFQDVIVVKRSLTSLFRRLCLLARKINLFTDVFIVSLGIRTSEGRCQILFRFFVHQEQIIEKNICSIKLI